MGQGKIRLLVVDDSIFMRMAVSAMCEAHDDIEIIGEAESGDEAVGMATSLQPDVITMDLDMPGMDGITATQLIRAEMQVPIIMLSGLSERGSELTYRGLKAGACDYVCKSASALDVDLSTIAEALVEKILYWGRHKPAQDVSVAAAAVPQADHDLALVILGEGGPQALSDMLSGVVQPRLPVMVLPDLPDPLFPTFLRFLEARIALPARVVGEGLPLRQEQLTILPPGHVAEFRLQDGALQLSAKPGEAALAAFLNPSILASSKLLVMVLSGDRLDTAAVAQLAAAGHRLVAQEADSCMARGAVESLHRHGLVSSGLSISQLRQFIQ